MTDNTLSDVFADRAMDKAILFVKVVAAAPCPFHVSTIPCLKTATQPLTGLQRDSISCSCAAAMATMDEWDHFWCKRIWYCMISSSSS